MNEMLVLMKPFFSTMKQSIFTVLLALSAILTLPSCSDESQNVTEITLALTDVLKKAVDKPSADACAEEAGALDKRLKRAQHVTADALGTPTAKSYEANQTAENTAYGEATQALCAELGRIKSGVPCNAGVTVSDTEIKVILEKDGLDKLPDTQDYYGSSALREALSFDPTTEK